MSANVENNKKEVVGKLYELSREVKNSILFKGRYGSPILFLYGTCYAVTTKLTLNRFGDRKHFITLCKSPGDRPYKKAKDCVIEKLEPAGSIETLLSSPDVPKEVKRAVLYNIEIFKEYK